MNVIKRERLRRSIFKFRTQFALTEGAALNRALGAQFIERTVLSLCPEGWRERVYGPLTTLKLFVGQVLGADHACMDAVARQLSERVSNGQAQCSLNTGPYCKARQRLPVELVHTLSEELARRLESAAPEAWRWRGRAVKLFDATTVSMPDTPSNQAAYPQSREQKPGLGFPVARIGALISLATGAVLGHEMAACRGKGTGEATLFRKLYQHIVPGDIVLADALHCSWWTIAALVRAGADVVMPISGNRIADFSQGVRLGRKDHVVQWPRLQRKPWMSLAEYQALPEALTLRQVQVGPWTLVTTLTDARTVRAQDLQALYAMRWNIEVDFRTLKTMLAMDILRCKSKEMIDKEVAVYILANNLVRWAMARAAQWVEVLPRALSFMAAKRALTLLEQHLRHRPKQNLKDTTHAIIRLIGRCRLPHRPGRVEPRAKKRRPKPLPLLMAPRPIARQEIMRNRRYAFLKVAA